MQAVCKETWSDIGIADGKRPSERVFSDGLCIALSDARPDIYGSVWGVSMILESGFAILGKR